MSGSVIARRCHSNHSRQTRSPLPAAARQRLSWPDRRSGPTAHASPAGASSQGCDHDRGSEQNVQPSRHAGVGMIGTESAATSRSFKRRRRISGPIAAGSPMVIAMRGGFMAASGIGPGQLAARLPGGQDWTTNGRHHTGRGPRTTPATRRVQFLYRLGRRLFEEDAGLFR